jgi:hypothetical protein
LKRCGYAISFACDIGDFLKSVVEIERAACENKRIKNMKHFVIKYSSESSITTATTHHSNNNSNIII